MSRKLGRELSTKPSKPRIEDTALPKVAIPSPIPSVARADTLSDLVEELRRQELLIKEGGGAKAIGRQHDKGRLTARERIARLVDPHAPFFELGLWAAWGMYTEWGGAPSAGVITGIGRVAGRR